MASTVGELNFLALEDRLLNYSNEYVMLVGSEKDMESYLLARFRQLSRLGKWVEALSLWQNLSLDTLSESSRGIAAHHYAVYLYQCGQLTDAALAEAEEWSRSEKSALGIRNLAALRGYWLLEQDEYFMAKESLQEAVALAHKAGKIDRRSEICLAIAKYKLNELSELHHLSEQFAYGLDESCCRVFAILLMSIGDYEQAIKYARSAYSWAWADGDPYIRYSEVKKAEALLQKLGVKQLAACRT